MREFLLCGQWVFLLLLLGGLVALWLEHTLFDVRYPEDRTGLYLYPLFIGTTCFALDALTRKYKALVALPLLYFPVHFLFSMNLTHSSLWANQCIPDRFYNKVVSEAKEGQAPPTVGGYFVTKLPWLWINRKHEGRLGQMQSSDYPGLLADFQVCRPEEFPNWPVYYDTIDYDVPSGLSLLKRKAPMEKIELIRKTGISSEENIVQEFFGFIELKADSIAGKTLLVDFEFTFSSPDEPFSGWLVVDVNSTSGEQLRYEFTALYGVKKSWRGDAPFRCSMYIPELPANAHRLSAYIWNKNGQRFSIKNGKCTLYVLHTDYW